MSGLAVVIDSSREGSVLGAGGLRIMKILHLLMRSDR